MFTSRPELMREYAGRASASGLRLDVPSDGVFNAQIAIVAEAPGEHEVRMRVPLVGGSGKYLWDALKKYNISRQNVYVTNVVKRQVSLNSKVDEARDSVSKNELTHWEELLRWELSHLPNLQYVLLLGNYALDAIVGHTGITNWRGSVLDVTIGGRTVTAVCAVNPAFVLREPKQDVVFRMDMAKLERVRTGQFKKPNINVIINPSPDEAIRWIEKMRDERLPVGGDIETISMETACLGLANSTSEAMCIPFRTNNDNFYSIKDEVRIRRAIQGLFDDPSVRLVFQNAMFDSYFMWLKDRIRIRKVWFDTMLAHHTLYPQLPHNLGFITSQYTDHPYYKDEGKEWKEGGNIDDFWRYNGKDCCIMLAAQQRMEKELVHFKLDKFFFDHVMHIQPYLVEMTVGGLKIDTELKKRIGDDLREKLAIMLQEFHSLVHEATGDPTYNPNPASPKQLAALFFQHLKLVGRGQATDAENRKRMHDHPRTKPVVKKLLTTLDEYKEKDKFLSTYVESRVSADGRMRCEYKQMGVVSAPGRLSSSALIWKDGMNLQNQPAEAHPMFIADEGWAFGYIDLAQAEARVVGWEAKIEKWKEQFEKARIDGKYDAHRALCSEMYGIPYDDTPKYDNFAKDEAEAKERGEVFDAAIAGKFTLRYIAKRCRHGLNYRMAADRLATTTGLSYADAERNYHLYHRANPELRVWWDDLEREVKATKCLFNAYGRRLIVMERLDDESLKSIVAFKPQSTIGDKINRVIYKCREDDRWPLHGNVWHPAARMALNIHDALIVLAPIDHVRTCVKLMIEHAEEPVYIHGEPLIIPADPKISVAGEDGVHRWSTLKKVKKGEL